MYSMHLHNRCVNEGCTQSPLTVVFANKIFLKTLIYSKKKQAI